MGRSIRSKRNKELRSVRRARVAEDDARRLAETAGKLAAMASAGPDARVPVDNRASERAMAKAKAKKAEAKDVGNEKQWQSLLPRVPAAMEVDNSLGVKDGRVGKPAGATKKARKPRSDAAEDAMRAAAMAVCGREPGGVGTARAHASDAVRASLKSAAVLTAAFAPNKRSKSARRAANTSAKRALA